VPRVRERRGPLMAIVPPGVDIRAGRRRALGGLGGGRAGVIGRAVERRLDGG
jgi:hypothetical protein